jgi:hypothetical protein
MNKMSIEYKNTKHLLHIFELLFILYFVVNPTIFQMSHCCTQKEQSKALTSILYSNTHKFNVLFMDSPKIAKIYPCGSVHLK